MPQRRSATYNKEDLQRLKAEGEEVEPVLCAAFTAGSASDSDEAMAAKAHRQHTPGGSTTAATTSTGA